MERTLMFAILLGLFCSCQAQITEFTKMTSVGSLPQELHECSGMVMLEEDVYAGLNDSGNEPVLYVFSLRKKIATRTVRINGVRNVDWEELTSDDTYLYIGDTGNNAGARTDLSIYKVRKEEVLSKESVDPEKIIFSYADQKKFKPNNNHNFDCEAMIALGDSLYLFTKNRDNLATHVYAISKEPGIYKARQRGKFQADGLVTGAAIREGSTNELALLGYKTKEQNYRPFIWYFSSFTGADFFSKLSTYMLFDGTLQTETILFADSSSVFITNEEEHGDEGKVFSVRLP